MSGSTAITEIPAHYPVHLRAAVDDLKRKQRETVIIHCDEHELSDGTVYYTVYTEWGNVLETVAWYEHPSDSQKSCYRAIYHTMRHDEIKVFQQLSRWFR